MIGAWVNSADTELKLERGQSFGRVCALSKRGRTAKAKASPILCQMSLPRGLCCQASAARKRDQRKDPSSRIAAPAGLSSEGQRRYLIQRFGLEEAEGITSDEELNQAAEVLRQFWNYFSWDKTTIGSTDLVKHSIEVKEGTKPVKQRYRPIAPHLEDNFKRQLDQWLEQEIVEPSTSPWAANLVPVIKKNGEVRWCVVRKDPKITRSQRLILTLIGLEKPK